MDSPNNWNRTAVQLLIADAKTELSLLDGAVADPNFEIRMRAMRNGRRAFKDIRVRARSFLLAPEDVAVIDQALEKMKARLRFLRERLI